LLVVAASVVLFLGRYSPSVSGQESLSAIHATVQIMRESNGAVHIVAFDDRDLIFAQVRPPFNEIFEYDS